MSITVVLVDKRSLLEVFRVKLSNEVPLPVPGETCQFYDGATGNTRSWFVFHVHRVYMPGPEIKEKATVLGLSEIQIIGVEGNKRSVLSMAMGTELALANGHHA